MPDTTFDHRPIFVRAWGTNYRSNKWFQQALEVNQTLAKGDREKLTRFLTQVAEREVKWSYLRIGW